MQVSDNVSLAGHSTMRLGGRAAHLTPVTSREELREALNWALGMNLPTLMIGEGSNIVWRDEGFPGLVIVNKILGYEAFAEDESNTYLTLGAGEDWDSVVQRSVEAGLTGIEALSLIPGTVGATPVQNVGAYGQEISQTLTTVEAFDRDKWDFVTLRGDECQFGYRDSRFKSSDRGRFFITGISLHLTHGNPQPPFYPSLQSYLTEHGISDFTPQAIRDAVIAIRSAKLPDPKNVNNNGSFFANPIVPEAQALELQDANPGLPSWYVDDAHRKLSAAWLVEHAGFKDHHDAATGMATWSKQSLVLVNEHATSTADLLAFRQKIIDAVQQQFGITLAQEPELLP